jgi:hypothetical protein
VTHGREDEDVVAAGRRIGVNGGEVDVIALRAGEIADGIARPVADALIDKRVGAAPADQPVAAMAAGDAVVGGVAYQRIGEDRADGRFDNCTTMPAPAPE